jgi:glycosyltransferase involved in cell wall biosynthesis
MSGVDSPSADQVPPVRVSVIITRGERGGAQVHVRDLVAGLLHRVQFHVFVGEDGFLVDALRKVGALVTVVPSLQRAISPHTDVRALRDLRHHVRAARPHVVHTHSTKAGLLGRVVARSIGVPVVHTAHAWSFSDGLSWKRKAWAIPVEWMAGRITDRFITVSEADREVGERYGVVRRPQARIIHNGVPTEAPRAQPGSGVPPVIVTVARLAPPKDIALLLTALSTIDAPFHLRVIGDGELRAGLEQQAQHLGLTDRVTWLGTRGDVPDQLADAHIFALISRQEGFPISILEAMRAGLPVVASDVGGVREAVKPRQTGFLVPRGDATSLADALRSLLERPELRNELGQAGHTAFLDRFSADSMCRTTLSVYRELAPHTRAQP